ncbi:unknown [Firmicutes bacterium CAG:646]|nr:unknown [Firmicutes bacterium CAG:646]
MLWYIGNIYATQTQSALTLSLKSQRCAQTEFEWHKYFR